MDRRDFLKTAAGAVAANELLSQNAHGETSRPEVHGMIYRTLGRTGERVSAIGLGGYHIGKAELPEQQADSARAPSHRSRHHVHGQLLGLQRWRQRSPHGQGAADGYRNKVFLMTKIDGRTKAAAAQQIDESLQRLQTDHVDLMQFHEVIRLEDPDRIFAEGGAMEAMHRRQGRRAKCATSALPDTRIRYVHLRMLDHARSHKFHFDAVQMPLNVMDAHFRSFTHEVLPVLTREGIAPLGHEVLWRSLHSRERNREAHGGAALLPQSAHRGADYRHRQPAGVSIRRSKRRAPSSRCLQPRWRACWSAPGRQRRKGSSSSTKLRRTSTEQRTNPRCWVSAHHCF